MTMNATRRGMMGLALGALAAGCGGGATLSGPEGDNLTAPEYRLGAGDQVRITQYGETEPVGQYIVSSQGTVAYPLVGEVLARGRTVREFTQALTEALSQYVRRPNVTVEVMNYRPFFILGEVRMPGTYPYSANLTVLNAVATAQGFTYRANRRRVYIQHAGEDAEHEYRLTQTTPVQPGDTIRIGERLF